MEALATLDEVYISRFLAPYQQPTRGKYQRTLFEWLAFCINAGLHILEGDRVLIEQWAAMLGKRVSKTTVASSLVPVCGFYRWAFQEGLLPVDQGAHVRRPSRPRRSTLDWLEREQAERVLAASRTLGHPVAGLVHLQLLNGLRLSESLAVRGEHFGARDGVVTLRLPLRKRGAMDTVSVPTATVEALGPISAGPLFPGVTPAQVYRRYDQLAEIARLEFRLRPHMLRVTFVTLSLDAGVPARDIIASAGWVSAQMLQHYDRAHASIRRNASHRLAKYIGT